MKRFNRLHEMEELSSAFRETFMPVYNSIHRPESLRGDFLKSTLPSSSSTHPRRLYRRTAWAAFACLFVVVSVSLWRLFPSFLENFSSTNAPDTTSLLAENAAAAPEAVLYDAIPENAAAQFKTASEESASEEYAATYDATPENDALSLQPHAAQMSAIPAPHRQAGQQNGFYYFIARQDQDKYFCTVNMDTLEETSRIPLKNDAFEYVWVYNNFAVLMSPCLAQDAQDALQVDIYTLTDPAAPAFSYSFTQQGTFSNVSSVENTLVLTTVCQSSSPPQIYSDGTQISWHSLPLKNTNPSGQEYTLISCLDAYDPSILEAFYLPFSCGAFYQKNESIYLAESREDKTILYSFSLQSPSSDILQWEFSGNFVADSLYSNDKNLYAIVEKGDGVFELCMIPHTGSSVYESWPLLSNNPSIDSFFYTSSVLYLQSDAQWYAVSLENKEDSLYSLPHQNILPLNDTLVLAADFSEDYSEISLSLISLTPSLSPVYGDSLRLSLEGATPSFLYEKNALYYEPSYSLLALGGIEPSGENKIWFIDTKDNHLAFRSPDSITLANENNFYILTHDSKLLLFTPDDIVSYPLSAA